MVICSLIKTTLNYIIVVELYGALLPSSLLSQFLHNSRWISFCCTMKELTVKAITLTRYVRYIIIIDIIWIIPGITKITIFTLSSQAVVPLQYSMSFLLKISSASSENIISQWISVFPRTPWQLWSKIISLRNELP